MMFASYIYWYPSLEVKPWNIICGTTTLAVEELGLYSYLCNICLINVLRVVCYSSDFSAGEKQAVFMPSSISTCKE